MFASVMILSLHSLATIGATLVAVALGLSWRYAGYSNVAASEEGATTSSSEVALRAIVLTR